MKPKSLMLFAVATGCGLVAMVGAQQLLATRTDAVPKVRVLVARAEIEPGVKLNADLVGFRDVAKDAVPQGAVVSEEQYANRALRVRAFPGQLIQMAQLGEKGQFGTSLDIPAGMRLVSVPATATMTHSGIMKPGDRVDVVLTYKMARRKGNGQQILSKTILEYIQVYAMGEQRIGSESAEAGVAAKDVKNVTLLVTPTQGEIVNLATTKGEIHLALRGVLDKESVASKGTDEAQLEFLRTELSEDGVNTYAEAEPASPTPAPAPEPEAKPTFVEFVQAEVPPPTPVVPEAPKWKIEVFQGDERKVYELELPDTAKGMATEVPSNMPPRVSSQNSLWNSPLARWVTGARNIESGSASLAP